MTTQYWLDLRATPPPGPPTVLPPEWVLERARVQVAQAIGFDPLAPGPWPRGRFPASRGRQLVWWLAVQFGLDVCWLARASDRHRATVGHGVRVVQESLDQGGWALEALAYSVASEFPGSRLVRGSIIGQPGP